VGEDVGDVAACFFEGIGQDRQSIEVPILIHFFGQFGIRPVNRVVAGAQGNHGWGRPPQ
jgi:hypothetical protein